MTKQGIGHECDTQTALFSEIVPYQCNISKCDLVLLGCSIAMMCESSDGLLSCSAWIFFFSHLF